MTIRTTCNSNHPVIREGRKDSNFKKCKCNECKFEDITKMVKGKELEKITPNPGCDCFGCLPSGELSVAGRATVINDMVTAPDVQPFYCELWK